MNSLSARVVEFLERSKMLLQAGATTPSVLLFPLRRRGRHPRCELRLRNGLSIVSPADEPLVSLFQEIWVRRCYRGEELVSVPGATIIDLGANVGVFTLWAANRYPAARVLALEPSPRLFRFLSMNIERNHLVNVTAVQAACAGRRGEATLYGRGVEAMNSLYSRDNYGSSFHARESVTLVTLDDLFERFAVDRCALLKMDCEGAEYETLFNAGEETLHKIEKISMEYHVGLNPNTPEQLETHLRHHGFEVERLPLEDAEGGFLYATRRP